MSANIWKTFAVGVSLVAILTFTGTAWGQLPAPLMHLTFDEGSGGTAADSSGNAHDGTFNGGAAWMAGKIGAGAVQFNGTTSYVQVPDFDLTPEFTLSFWWNENDPLMPAPVCDKGGLFSWGAPYATNSVVVWLSISSSPIGGILPSFMDANGFANPNAPLEYTDANTLLSGWHLYVATISATGNKTYVDGNQVGSGVPNGGSTINPATDIFIGARANLAANRFFGGAMDDVQIFGVVLDANQVLELYNAGGGVVPNGDPTANAGPDAKVMRPNLLALTGAVSDDALPNPPAACTAAWSVVSGPGTVTFGDAAAASTTADFSAAGTYVLRLTASDSVATASDDVQVIVLAPGDFTGDGRVDGLDFLNWQSNYPNFVGGATPDGGDGNGDGKVDGLDFLVWQSNYGS